ncbi:hypothetical protein [Candidatus Binatus sp.]|uniref:hypothetical protein n=1 Tax=Candidatus Binatus sp. TaxID=2811406 RepID=UPI003CC66BC1
MEAIGREQKEAASVAWRGTIELNASTRVDRCLAAARLISFMTFPDDPELRKAAEITLRAKLAAWYAYAFAHRSEEKQKAVFLRLGPKMKDELPRALADPAKWAKDWIFKEFLEPAGGLATGADMLADAPSLSQLAEEFTKRWFGITYTGKLVCLIGSMHQHHDSIGPSLNKAIYLLCEMDGKDERLTANLRRLGFPAVYESSLKEAWHRFKPVAHLCAAYVVTDCVFYQAELARDFMEYWHLLPAFFAKDLAFHQFCHVARAAQRFLTSFRPHGRSEPVVPKNIMYAIPEEIFSPSQALFQFQRLTSEELTTLRNYRAPKLFV